MQMKSFLNESSSSSSSSSYQQHTQTYPSPLSTRLLDAVRLLQGSTTSACNGTPTTRQRITELV
jgi:hypothetical protein